MSPETASLLAHDVGKYVARIARNVDPAGPMPAALIPLLVKDLYELPTGGPASRRFAELADDDEALIPVRVALAEIDTLESGVRSGEPAACRRACALALEVESVLRAFAGATR